MFAATFTFAVIGNFYFYKSGLASPFAMVPMLPSITFTLIEPQLLQNGAWLGSVVAEEALEPKIDLGTDQDGDNEEDPTDSSLNKIASGNRSRSGSTRGHPLPHLPL